MLERKIEFVKGVGPKMAAKFNRLGIETVQDLLMYFPRTYRDYSKPVKISDIANDYSLLGNDNKITIRGTILGIDNKKTSRRRFTVTEAVVEDGTGTIKVVWFNQPFLTKMLPAGREVILNGKVSYNNFSHELTMESPERADRPKIVPVYGETEGMRSGYIAAVISRVIDRAEQIEEWLPLVLSTNSKFEALNPKQNLKDKNPKQSVIPAQAGIQGDNSLDSTSQATGWNDNENNNSTIEQLNNLSLTPIQEALKNIHQPENSEKLAEAQRRLAFDELFMIALQSNITKEQLKKEKAPIIDSRFSITEEFTNGLPFGLTGDQQKAAEDILKDLAKGEPMNRLLNGDVGSGKTVVAAIAAFVAVKAGFRAVFMAPTAILANQHYETFCKLFANYDVTVGLVTSDKKENSITKKQDTITSKISKSKNSKPAVILNSFQDPVTIGMDSGSRAAGRNDKGDVLESDILIGTHALLHLKEPLENIGLVIVDEQHRFGVAQRAALQELSVISHQLSADNPVIPDFPAEGGTETIGIDSGSQETGRNDKSNVNQKMKPHFLSMTATPIPRTLQLALFGDLDVSIIREKPANRKEIKTRFVEPFNRDKAYEFIREHIKHGRQVFVVCPLIEDQADREVIPAEAGIHDYIDSTSQAAGWNDSASLFEEDRKSVKSEYEKLQTIFPGFKIEMLHGKMRAKEKDTIMSDFSSGRTNILVSTSVVEVGVDVPNASIMMIEDADRFGLAQLHQFRGRVGRGEHQSFCFLFSSTNIPKARHRLESMETTSDGFKLAEIDLETRGPGAIFGTMQSGQLDLRMASLSDHILIAQASEAAKAIAQEDPELSKYPKLKEKVEEYLSHKHLE